MSYWVSLNVNDEPVEVQPFEEGGTYPVGGSSLAELNVTYNYSKVFSQHNFSLRDLHGKMAKETTSKLDMLSTILGGDPDPDYWKPTSGNAAIVIRRLYSWAKQYPDAVWRVN